MLKIAALIAVFAIVLAGASENGSPEPYAYQYADPTGTHGASEQSDGNAVTGFYYVADPENGHQRRVDYIADANGFRASVQSNHDQVVAAYDAGQQQHLHHHAGHQNLHHHAGQSQGLQQQQASVYKQQVQYSQAAPQQVGYGYSSNGIYANQGASDYGSNQGGYYGARYGYGVPIAGYGYANNGLYANQGVSGYGTNRYYSSGVQQPQYAYQSAGYNTIGTAAAKPVVGGYSTSSQRTVYEGVVAPQQLVAQGVPTILGYQQPTSSSSSYYYSSGPAIGAREAGSQGVPSAQVSTVSAANTGGVISPASVAGAVDAEPQKKA